MSTQRRERLLKQNPNPLIELFGAAYLDFLQTIYSTVFDTIAGSVQTGFTIRTEEELRAIAESEDQDFDPTYHPDTNEEYHTLHEKARRKSRGPKGCFLALGEKRWRGGSIC